MARTFGTCERDARSRMVKQVVKIVRVSPRLCRPAVVVQNRIDREFHL